MNGYAVGGVWWIGKVGGDAGHKFFPPPAGTLLFQLNATLADDREAGVRFNLDERTLTVRLLASAPRKTRRRVSAARIRATCGESFSGRAPRQMRTRLWPPGSAHVRFHFRRDISRIARWCRLEDPVVGHVAFVKLRGTGAAPSPADRIARIGNKWAGLFAAGDPEHCRYEIQPVCERIACERPPNQPIENCTRPSAEFRNSFRDATVEEITIRGERAAAKFSNGEAIELSEDVSGLEHAGVWWWISKVGANAGRKFFR